MCVFLSELLLFFVDITCLATPTFSTREPMSSADSAVPAVPLQVNTISCVSTFFQGLHRWLPSVGMLGAIERLLDLVVGTLLTTDYKTPAQL